MTAQRQAGEKPHRLVFAGVGMTMAVGCWQDNQGFQPEGVEGLFLWIRLHE